MKSSMEVYTRNPIDGNEDTTLKQKCCRMISYQKPLDCLRNLIAEHINAVISDYNHKIV